MNTAVTSSGTALASNPYDASADLYKNAGDMLFGLSQGGALQNVNAYLNPFYEEVVNRSVSNMTRDRDRTLGSIGDAAISAGAFGGSRHALLEAEFLGEHNRQVGDLTASTMAQGYDNASNAARSDYLSAIQGMGQLGSEYFNVGNNIADRQMQSGTVAQNFLQQLLSGSANSYNSMVSSPYQLFDLLNAINAADPRRAAGTTTQKTTPGLLDWLSLGAGVYAAGQ